MNGQPPEEQPLSLNTHPEKPDPLPPYVLLVGLMPVVAYAVYVWRWAFDTPLMDDITLINSVNRFADNGFSDLKAILLEQLNDHRIVFSRLGALAVFGLRDYLDVRTLALAGYANLLLLGWLLWRLFRTTGLKPVYFLPVPFLLYSPHLYQISLWGLVSFQPPLATAFSLASLLVLAQPRRWAWALPLAVMALFAGGNGLMVFIAGGFLLRVQGRFRHLAGWLALTGAALGLYFFDYQFSSASQVSGGPLRMLGELLLNTTVFAGSYLSVFSESKAVPLSLGLGAGVLAVSAGLFFRKFFPNATQTRPGKALAAWVPVPVGWPLFAALLSLLGTAAMIGLARSAGGPREMTSDRFHLYSSVLLVVFYLVLVGSLVSSYRRWLLRLVLPLAVLANAYAYLQYRPIRDTMTEGMAADAYNFTHHRVFLQQYPNSGVPGLREFRHCRFPVTFSDSSARHIRYVARHGRPLLAAHTTVGVVERPVPYQTGVYRFLELGVDSPTAGALPDGRVWLFLVGEQPDAGLFFLAARRQKAPLAGYLRTGRFYADRFYATARHRIPAGRYRLGLCWFAGGTPVAVCTPGVVTL